MDFNDTAEEAKFRKEASDWLSANAEKKEHSVTFTVPQK